MTGGWQSSPLWTLLNTDTRIHLGLDERITLDVSQRFLGPDASYVLPLVQICSILATDASFLIRSMNSNHKGLSYENVKVVE